MDRDLLPQEAADLLRMPKQSLLRLAQRGGIGHHRIGKQYRFTENDLAEYRAAQHVAADFMGRSRDRRRSAS